MIISQTPLRISFFSGASDIPSFYKREDGAALSGTINKYIFVMAHKTPHLGIKIMYDTIEEFPDVEQMQHLITKEALKYFNIHKEITVASISDILSKGSGLGSSSAFTVGLVNALSTQKWDKLSPRYLADVACEIEMDRCKYPIGKQDQFAAAYGGIKLYKFKKDDDVEITDLRIPNTTIVKFQENLMLVYSGKGRSANSILQRQEKAITEDKSKFELVKKSRDKAFIGARLLLNGDIDGFGHLLHEAWLDKKQVIEGITNDYFDGIYNRALQAGAIGGKLLGAGGGGFFLLYVPKEKREEVSAEITKDTPCKIYDFEFTDVGSRVTAMYNN